jgi:hypothetical protein
MCVQQTFPGNWVQKSWRDTHEESEGEAMKVSLAIQVVGHTIAAGLVYK